MTTTIRKPIVGLALSALVLFGVGQGPAAAEVTELNGSAYGAFVKVGLFGGEPNQVGAAPEVSLPATGGRETNSLPSLVAQFGPATIFGGQYVDPGRNPSGELTVSTEGQTGADGFVTSSASVVNVGPGPLISDEMSSTCRATEQGVTASTTLRNTIVETSYDPETQLANSTVNISETPEPNTAVEGTIDHVGDRFRVVFNEQIVEGDTITVRAAHMYLLGNIAVGDLIIGQSVCGLSADGASTAPPTTVPGQAGAAPPDTLPDGALPEVTTTTEPTTTTTVEGDDDLNAASARAESDDDGGGGGAGLVIGGLVVATGLGLAGLMAYKRRKPELGPEPE